MRALYWIIYSQGGCGYSPHFFSSPSGMGCLCHCNKSLCLLLLSIILLLMMLSCWVFKTTQEAKINHFLLLLRLVEGLAPGSSLEEDPGSLGLPVTSAFLTVMISQSPAWQRLHLEAWRKVFLCGDLLLYRMDTGQALPGEVAMASPNKRRITRHIGRFERCPIVSGM